MAYYDNSPLCGFGGGPMPMDGFPGPHSSEQEWAQIFPIARFPQLPKRRPRYFWEPFVGVAVLVVTISLLVSLTLAAADDAGQYGPLAKVLIWTEAILALGSVAYLWCGPNGEIERSPKTCYPIPIQVAQPLAHGLTMEGLRNPDGPMGSSFCARCLVWRPGDAVKGLGHHCSICQRCVEGFDHHCNVFGRCITKPNMPCFYLLIGMLIAGILTTTFTMMCADSFKHGYLGVVMAGGQ